MIFIAQTVFIFLVFTILFIGVRLIPGMDMKSLITSSEGAGWLYSELGLIFGVFAAFIIQAQAKKWDELSSSIRQEVSSLRRLFWISSYVSVTEAESLQESIRMYLKQIIHEEWRDIDKGNRSLPLEASIRSLQEKVIALSSLNPTYSLTVSALVRGIFESHEERMFQSAKRTPLLLKMTIYVGAAMMIGLSYFIGVNNIWIDYIFTGSISFLVILIIMVIRDLEHPYQPGHWHITQDAYCELLEEVNNPR
jgi:hypothetical protein